MRIAVCRPHGPFRLRGRGGRRGHCSPTSCARATTRWSSSRFPFAWDGTRAARQRAPVAADRPQWGAEAGRARDRHEVPLLRDPAPEQGDLARPPVPAGLRLRPRASSASSRSRRSTARRGDAVERFDRVALLRGEEDLHHLRQRRRAAQALLGLRRDRPAAAAAEARLPHGGLRRLRAVGEPARPLQADRPAHRSGEGGPRAAGRDRRRRARPRAARAARVRDERADRVHRPRRRR